jgi:hypothetical protein
MSITEHASQSPVNLVQDVVTPAPGIGPDGAYPYGQPDLAAAVSAQRAQRRSGTRLQRSLARLLRRRRISRAAAHDALSALAAENQHMGAGRDPGLATHGETLVRATGNAGADAHLARSQRRLNRAARRTDRLRARQARLLVRAGHRAGDLVRHPDGGQETVTSLQRHQAAQRAQIQDEMARGSRKHHRLPRWIGRTPKLVLLVDFCLLLYFFAGITDVNWASPLSANLAFAVLLAAMVTTLSYGFLAFAGYRLRSYKDHSGAVSFRDLDALTWMACGASIAGVAAVAALMFIRMRTEVLYALGPQATGTALMIALVVAVVSVLANFLVVGIHALDGSDQVARLNSLSAATSGPLSKAHRMREKAALIPHRIAVRRRLAHRAAVKAITDAGRHLTAADRVIEAAHAVHQGTGPHSGPVADPNQHDHVAGYRETGCSPQADLRPLRTTLDHIDSSLPIMRCD